MFKDKNVLIVWDIGKRIDNFFRKVKTRAYFNTKPIVMIIKGHVVEVIKQFPDSKRA